MDEEAEVLLLPNTFTKDFLASAFVFNHLHNRGLYMCEAFILFEPFVYITSFMITMELSRFWCDQWEPLLDEILWILESVYALGNIPTHSSSRAYKEHKYNRANSYALRDQDG